MVYKRVDLIAAGSGLEAEDRRGEGRMGKVGSWGLSFVLMGGRSCTVYLCNKVATENNSDAVHFMKTWGKGFEYCFPHKGMINFGEARCLYPDLNKYTFVNISILPKMYNFHFIKISVN